VAYVQGYITLFDRNARDKFVYVVSGGRLLGSVNVDKSRKRECPGPLEVYIEPAATVRSSRTVQEALGLMISSGIANVAVVDEAGIFLGVLSFGDMYDIVQQQRERGSEASA